VLRLLELHPQAVLTSAIEQALATRTHSRDGIAQFIPPPEPWEQTSFTLAGREHLRHVAVACTNVSAYGQLLAVGGGG